MSMMWVWNTGYPCVQTILDRISFWAQQRMKGPPLSLLSMDKVIGSDSNGMPRECPLGKGHCMWKWSSRIGRQIDMDQGSQFLVSFLHKQPYGWCNNGCCLQLIWSEIELMLRRVMVLNGDDFQVWGSFDNTPNGIIIFLSLLQVN